VLVCSHVSFKIKAGFVEVVTVDLPEWNLFCRRVQGYGAVPRSTQQVLWGIHPIVEHRTTVKKIGKALSGFSRVRAASEWERLFHVRAPSLLESRAESTHRFSIYFCRVGASKGAHATPIRVEYPGAPYHVMSRGDRPDKRPKDSRDFLECGNEAERSCRFSLIILHPNSRYERT